ncbi:hypothetical protein CXB51_013953 [Gossypium anomalum]|uniref:60S ribosomal protein L36 n=1 Tax=Gossypium anomalum TaxID=47600 RepID=A0A8J6D270_9ROSI|nr:hypothetical protein CXB51_013953 [Gossypium anomalum]
MAIHQNEQQQEDEEFLLFFAKETEQQPPCFYVGTHESLATGRREVVEWMLKVSAINKFTTLTAVLSTNYLDSFKEKPWMVQLLAITCLSLAAKVEETQHVPLLQVDTNYVFEAKTIRGMELLVLSTLKWKMYPVTPFSSLDRIIRRLGSKTHLQCEFLKRCECLLLCVISNSRSTHYLPSVLATAIMMHALDKIDFNLIDHQNRLMSVFKISEEKVNYCFKLILDVSTSLQPQNACKRKVEESLPPKQHLPFKKRHVVTKKELASHPSNRKGKTSKRVHFVRSLIREVAGFAPYEKRIIKLLKVGKEKRALKVAKRKLGTHKRAKKKREEMFSVLRKMRSAGGGEKKKMYDFWVKYQPYYNDHGKVCQEKKKKKYVSFLES